jgi:hypothetical protein
MWFTIFMWEDTNTHRVRCHVIPGVIIGAEKIREVIGPVFKQMHQGSLAWASLEVDTYCHGA